MRREAHRLSKQELDAVDDDKQFQAAVAKQACDHYFPGHTAGRRNDFPEAIRSYQAALRMEPSHYNSLFYLAATLADDKVNRLPEAVQLFTACIALRPDRSNAYRNRGQSQAKLGDLTGAEADFTAAVNNSSDAGDRYFALKSRLEFYRGTGAVLKSQADAEALVAVCEGEYERIQRSLGPNHADTVVEMNVLAATYLHVLQPHKAVALLEPSIDQVQKTHSTDRPDAVLDAQANLAHAYLKVGRFADAVGLAERTQEQLRSLYGGDDPRTLTNASVLASALPPVGRGTEQIELYEDLLRREQTALGPRHPDTLATQHNLARAYLDTGHADKAIPLLEELVEPSKVVLGANHPGTLTTLDSLASAYRRSDRFLDALPIYEQVLAIRKATLGEADHDTLKSVNNLGLTYVQVGRFSDAATLLEPALVVRRAAFGDEHYETLTLQLNLARAYRDAGRYQEGVALFEELLRKLQTARNADRSMVCFIQLDLGLGHIDAKQFVAAERVVREALEAERKIEQPAGVNTAQFLSVLGLSLLKQEKYAEAEAPLRECHIIRDALAPDDWSRFNALSQLGESLFGQRKFAEAEPLLPTFR